jgi:type IV secretory pathway VirB10-like protein
LVRQVDRQRVWNARGVAVALALGLLTGACKGDETTETTSAPESTTAPTTAAVTTTTAPASVTSAPVVPNMKPDEIAVRNVLDFFAHESTIAYETSDPNRPALLALVTGDFKQHLSANLTTFRANGELAQRPGGGVSPHQTRSVQWSREDTATALECWIDDMIVYRQGEEPGRADPARVSYKTTVIREADQQWRISLQEEQSKADTAGSCQGF